MSATREAPSTKKSDKLDIITPHRLSITILIKNFCQFRDSDHFKLLEDGNLKAKYRRDFCILILKLIQSPDLTLKELWSLLISGKYTIPKYVTQTYESVLQDLFSNGTGNLLDIIDSLNRVMTFNENTLTDAVKCFVSKSSVIGYYLRRLIINFEKLTFSEVTVIYHTFKRYFGNGSHLTFCADDRNTHKTDVWSGGKDLWTRRQAELFIATQAALIENNPEKAICPNDLQKVISNILRTNPDLAEAHFLSYLNCLRIKEFCGAVDSLYHSFDKYNLAETKVASEDKPRLCRFAALNLAVLHYHFGHRDEAIASLKEAIKIAQDMNDNICLQHALSWLYRLTKTNKDKLIEHSVLKSFELNLSYTTSLGIQTFVQLACLLSGKPCQIFEMLTKSDIINGQNNHRDLSSNCYAVKSSLWQCYGKPEMSSLWSQLLLYQNIDNPKPSKAYYGEAFCISVCNIGNYLLSQGEYNLAHCVLSFAKNRFPSEPNSHVWILCENIFRFVRAMHHENWNEAEAAAQQIMVIDQWESYFRLAELYFYKQDYVEADRCVNAIIDQYQQDDKYNFRGYQFVRAKVLLAEIQFACSYPTSVPPGVMDLLSNCLIDTNKYQLDYYTALIHMNLANVQLALGMTGQALKMLDKCMVQVMAHGGRFDRARCTLLYVKCLVADSKRLESGDRKRVVLEAAKMLDEVKAGFEKVEAYSRLKDALYLQAQLYHFIDLRNERNRCALEFRLLDEEYVTKNICTLVKYL